MATANYQITDTPRFLRSNNANYNTAHDAATGTIDVAYTSLKIGQQYSGGAYEIYRTVLGWDTSGLPDNTLIKSASIRIRTSNIYLNPMTILIKNGMPTYPTFPYPVEADYAIDNYSGNGGAVELTEESVYAYITLNATGFGWINRTGYTKFIIVSQLDNIESPPTGIEWCRIQGWASAPYEAYRPTLIVEYYTPTEIPVVGDPTYSVKATYAIATANVSNAGGGYTERGFEYGETEEATWAVRATGVWGATGNYSLTLPNLLPLTTYYGRAYVTNSFGTDWSDWTSFTTTATPSYGQYEESNSPTICFYLSEDDGMTWGQKHGPYTTDQADINVTKLLVRGVGKKKIKFTTTALTGISASVMCKLDIKARS